MKIIHEYSHFGGAEILKVRYPEQEIEILDVISAVKGNKTKISKEKTKMSRALISPIDLHNQFEAGFQNVGYREIRDSYPIEIPNSDVAISGAYKQIDFVKQKVMIEVQFGKYEFMFFDMAKFQYFFNENKADVGIEIVACHALQKKMSSGVSYGEQLIYEIEHLKPHFPVVPVKVILIDVDEA